MTAAQDSANALAGSGWSGTMRSHQVALGHSALPERDDVQGVVVDDTGAHALDLAEGHTGAQARGHLPVAD